MPNQGGYAPKLALYMVAPVVLALLILLVVVLHKWHTARSLKMVSLLAALEASAPLVLKFFFIAYPLVSCGSCLVCCLPPPIELTVTPTHHPRLVSGRLRTQLLMPSPATVLIRATGSRRMCPYSATLLPMTE